MFHTSSTPHETVIYIMKSSYQFQVLGQIAYVEACESAFLNSLQYPKFPNLHTYTLKNVHRLCVRCEPPITINNK